VEFSQKASRKILSFKNKMGKVAQAGVKAAQVEKILQKMIFGETPFRRAALLGVGPKGRRRRG